MSIEHKVVAWNIEWSDKLLKGLNAAATSAAQRERLQTRPDGIYQTIAEIAPDVLCITALLPSQLRLSDHKPVSCILTEECL